MTSFISTLAHSFLGRAYHLYIKAEILKDLLMHRVVQFRIVMSVSYDIVLYLRRDFNDVREK